jgi:hypothetical protein
MLNFASLPVPNSRSIVSLVYVIILPMFTVPSYLPAFSNLSIWSSHLIRYASSSKLMKPYDKSQIKCFFQSYDCHNAIYSFDTELQNEAKTELLIYTISGAEGFNFLNFCFSLFNSLSISQYHAFL